MNIGIFDSVPQKVLLCPDGIVTKLPFWKRGISKLYRLHQTLFYTIFLCKSFKNEFNPTCEVHNIVNGALQITRFEMSSFPMRVCLQLPMGILFSLVIFSLIFPVSSFTKLDKAVKIPQVDKVMEQY